MPIPASRICLASIISPLLVFPLRPSRSEAALYSRSAENEGGGEIDENPFRLVLGRPARGQSLSENFSSNGACVGAGILCRRSSVFPRKMPSICSFVLESPHGL